MKIYDSFDIRRLRPKIQSNWHLHLAASFAALLVIVGLLLAGAGGVVGLFGHFLAFSLPSGNHSGSAILLVAGLLVLWLGIYLWRRSRRRIHQALSLNIASHLLKKYNR
ncbi:hypothetical protein [Candidatus Pseudomonas adelgestsugas]|uniref:Uncharacterized protein n=1 Tax=Candidatus Pseudomonas adelgestsugas TaxID=1302376 RepID=A0ABX5RA29_9PSED|nr:hypothetical protein [Candidatus Pseudomonas adelgestsugas]QAX82131.1 hypothetical protein C3B55_00819 [Candidatus Pseudomonas adelgestsugas]